jgi:large subunit ribosomal protein L29
MKAKDLRERTTEHLQELEKTLGREVFDAKFRNFTNRLNDTSSIRKARRDLARVKTILVQRSSDSSASSEASATEGNS